MNTQVFREAQKAETKLRNIDKNRAKRIADVELAYEAKRQKFIGGLDLQVRAALRSAGVLSAGESADPSSPIE